MIIRLPKQFIYTSRIVNNYAYVKNGILFIKGSINFEALMYNLAYELNGYERCCYCNSYLSHTTRTLDHIYPRSWGGISIPDNLLPCCKSCNKLKSNMTLSQFQKFCKINSSKGKNNFYNSCIRQNAKIVQNGNFIIPSDWISTYDITELSQYLSFKHLERDKKDKIRNYYDKYHQYPYPIILSSNDWLFKGKYILHHAKTIRKPIVKAIILENVIVIRNTS